MDRARASRRTFRTARRHLSSVAADRLEGRTLLATFVVTTVADSGPGSLREAIEMANLSPTPDDVRFNIPGEGLWRTIAPLSPLPEIIAPLTIDGTTQPGYLRSPVVELNGAGAGLGANGLVLSAPTCVVRGLAINRFAGHGIAVGASRPAGPGGPGVPGGNSARIEMNYIGTDVTGNVDLGNGGAGVSVAAPGVTIGAATSGTSASAGRNVISGNGFAGVWVPALTPQAISGLALPGNLIGTNAAGNRALGNDREGLLIEGNVGTITIGGAVRTGEVRNVISGNAASGIRVATQPTGNVNIEGNHIGTDLRGANALGNGRSASLPYRDGVTFTGGMMRLGGPSITSRNVIAANGGAGVMVHSATDAQVVGNFIGTDATGSADLGNRTDGVALAGAQSAGRITGNVISGNGRNGVRAASSGRIVQIGGNYIGTNAAGTAALGNDDDGIELENVTTNAMIGGPGGPIRVTLINPAGTGLNVISANGGHGIYVLSDPQVFRAHQIIGNYIGADATGGVPLGNAGSGVYLSASGVMVGGSSTQRNVISANGANGVTIVGQATGQQPAPPSGNNQIIGNLIGVGVVTIGTGPELVDTGMGNRENGVAIYYSANNRIGSQATAGGNVIAYNGGNGVLVQGALVSTPPNAPAAAEGNGINGNAIFDNGKLGIDLALAGEGVTPNDLRDADLGPNRLQNHPVITEAAAVSTTGSGTAQIRFTLHSEPSRAYRLEFFANLAPDPTGRGEGRAFMGFTTVSTDAGGNFSGTFTGSFSLPVAPRTPPAVIVPYFTATATAAQGSNTSEFSPAVRAVPNFQQPGPEPQGSSHVVGRHVFYNNSAFDRAGGDDAAVAPDKQALLPGQAPTFANVTNYNRGLNGVMVDIAALPEGVVLTPDEFEARAASTASGDEFEQTFKPYAVNVRRGAGVNGSDRVTLYWSDNLPTVDGVAPAVMNGWLEVKVLASAVTGLANSDVFYFGNLVGETGNPTVAGAGSFRVDAIDVMRTRAASPWDPPMLIQSRFDHNRDGAVDGVDVTIVRSNVGRRLDPFNDGPVISATAGSTRYRPPVRRLADEVLIVI